MQKGQAEETNRDLHNVTSTSLITSYPCDDGLLNWSSQCHLISIVNNVVKTSTSTSSSRFRQ